MANTPQARKRARQAEKRRQLNASQRSMMRTHVKKVLKALQAGDHAAAQAAYQVAVPVLDRYATRGLIHPNKAARHKSRLNARIRALDPQASPTPPKAVPPPVPVPQDSDPGGEGVEDAAAATS